MSSAKFQSLNDDCIFEIFSKCSRKDLCAISQTNKRLQELEFIYLLQKDPMFLMTLSQKTLQDVGFEVRFSMRPYLENCPKSLRRFIKNICIELPSGGYAKNMASFIRSNCNDVNLKTIKFTDGILADRFGYRIKDILKNVETVIFDDCHAASNLFDNILKYCHSLKHLSVNLSEKYRDASKDKFILQKYPKLQHFQCYLYTEFEMDNWKIFFQHNPNIKALTLYFIEGDEENMEKITELIAMIMNHAIHLERLFLSFEGYYDVPSIFHNLQILCKRESFKHLELRFHGWDAEEMLYIHGEELVSLKALKGIHLNSITFKTISSKTFTLVHLKLLQLTDFSNFCERIWMKDSLPALEELHVVDAYLSQLTIFIRYLKKLKKIVACTTLSLGSQEVNIAELNAIRQSLPGSCELVIFTAAWNVKTDLSFKLVKIKRVEYKFDWYNGTSPFISYYADENL